MPDEHASFDADVDTSEMSISVQKKGWEDILRKQCIEKVNADPDEIDISIDDSHLEDKDHIEAIEGEDPQISFATALQVLDHLQHLLLPLATQKCSVSWLLLLKSCKT